MGPARRRGRVTLRSSADTSPCYGRASSACFRVSCGSHSTSTSIPPAADEGIRFGWDVQLTEEATEVEVRFAQAAIPDWAVTQGRAPDDELQDILTTATGLSFRPQRVGRDGAGYLPEGTTDPGFFDVDEIEFF